MTELQRIKEYFASHQVPLAHEWLQSCVDWCKENSLPENYTEKDLQLKVYEQWLLLDLRDVETPSLPPGLSSKVKYTLQGTYSLQVMQAVDISKPKLWQIQRIRNDVATKNADPDNEFGKRVLQLTLTDGVQEVEAMEFKPISCLNINVTPGIKIRVMGPVMVRHGRLMLENHHVKVIGGEVEEIKVRNAAENVLARALGLKENPNPFVIDESILTANMDAIKDNKKIVANANVQPELQIDDKLLRELESDFEEKPSVPPEYDIDEELLREFEEDLEENSPDLFDEMDVDEEVLNNINIDDLQGQQESAGSFKDSFSLNETGFLHNLPSSTQITNVQPKPNVITVEKLKQLRPNIGKGKFKIKAKFKTVVEKMTLHEDHYHLVISVEDGSGDIAVRVHSNLVAEFAELDSKSVVSLKEKILENDDGAKEKLLKVLKSIKDRLVELDGVFEIEITRGEKYPVFTNVL